MRRASADRATGLGSAADEARAARDIGEVLEALVRSLAHRDRLAEGHARRFITLCQDQGPAVLEWRTTELRLDGKLALTASDEVGSFILPGYEAGLRQLRVTPEATDLDVLLLGRMLSNAEQGEISVLRLHDWFWRGGAIGFAPTLAEPFDRIFEFVLPGPIDAAEHWAEVGRVAIERWNEAAWKAGEVVPAAELAERYRAPMERYQTRVLEGALSLGEPDMQALRELADDSRGWAKLEMDVLLKHPELRHALPEAQLASRVKHMVLAAEEVDARLLDLLGLLSESDGDEDECLSTLDNVDLGAAVASKVTEAGVDEDALLDFVDFAGEHSVQGLVQQLGERALGEGNAMDALACLMRHWGPRRLFARFGDRKPPAALMTGLMKLALDRGLAASQLVEVLDHLPPETAATVLAAIPALRDRAEQQVERLLEMHPGACAALVQRMLDSSTGACMVGDSLRLTQGEGWNRRVLRGTLQSLVRAALGREYVLPLFRTRTVSIDVRLAALAVLSDDRELRDEVLRRRATDMMEPAEIRAALKEARAR
jgi:hypothetical protein